MQADTRTLLTERDFLTAAGTETYLYFQQQFPMREFCAFEIFDHQEDLEKLEQDYLFPLISTVSDNGQGLLLDALIWRAHPDFVAALGYAEGDLERINRRAVARTRETVDAWRASSARRADDFPVLITADIGPRGDGYRIDSAPSVQAAADYHRAQMQALAGAGADVVCALTMTSANEATGIALAAAELQIPIIVSPTVETDGRLPDGTTLAEFVRDVDDGSDGLPIYYMINCAHPTHAVPALEAAAERGEAWLSRLKGFRANCSKKSHEELDNSTELDRGNPTELAGELKRMKDAWDLRVLGGCCGTDVEHIAEIARATSTTT